MRELGLLLGTEGVLCSTAHLQRQAWETVLSLNRMDIQGIEGLDFMALSREEGLDALLGLTGIELSPAEKAYLTEEKNEQYRQLLTNISPSDLLPGTVEFLLKLKEEGVRLCLVTKSKNAVLILRQLGLNGIFDAICDGNDSLLRTGDSDIYHYAARLLSLPPNACMVWENCDNYLRLAREAGFQTVCGSADTVREAIRGA